MVRVSKDQDERNIKDYQSLPISSLDTLGKHIFDAFPEIEEKHPQVVKQYYQIFLNDYQRNDNYTHTEKIDDLTYQRLAWLKDQKCGYYHEIINRAVLMAYVMYRSRDQANDESNS